MRRRVLLNGSGGTDFSKKYLTFKALEAGTFTFTGNAIEYSVDNGNMWITLASGTTTPSIAAGSKILWKASGLTPNSSIGIGTFSSTQQFDVEGNIMSLYYGDDYANQKSLSGKIYAFFKLFKDSKVVDASGLILPATTLPESCCRNMFYRCTSLTTAPELPATTVGPYCCYQMFYDCISLTTSPDLPATTLARDCYNSMFYDCTSLTTAPELPATTLVKSCYTYMFYRCTSLTTAPSVLPAKTLAISCYNGMFSGCTSLTTAPELPATTLAESCYDNMFYRCTSLNSIKCLATDISASNCTKDWVRNVASSGTFTKASSMSSWTTGTNGIPSGWTIENYVAS